MVFTTHTHTHSRTHTHTHLYGYHHNHGQQPGCREEELNLTYLCEDLIYCDHSGEEGLSKKDKVF